MNRYYFDLEQIDTHTNELAKLFVIINTIGTNVDYHLKNDLIHAVEVDFPFDYSFPDDGVVVTQTQVVENSEIMKSPELKLLPYVTVGSIVGIVTSKVDAVSDFSNYYLYKITNGPHGPLNIYVGIANSSLSESYAPFGVREGQLPSGTSGLAITSESALQNMLNSCSRFPVNPSTGLSARDLMATSL